MSLIKVDYGEVGGDGGNAPNLFNFTNTQMNNATDASPLIIYGDFSSATQIATYGLYASSAGYQTPGYNMVSITKGTMQNVYVATNGANTAYRHVTVYDDRVEFGTGNANNATFNSAYGIINTIIFGTPET